MTLLAEEEAVSAALRVAEKRYRESHPRSAARQMHAASALPGGSTRSAIYYSPFPLAWAGGHGNRLVDVDGREYLDFLGDYSAGLYGHNNARIAAAINRAVKDGLVLGGPNVYEAALALAIRARFPSIDLIRFTNSGTEANLMALVTVRALRPSRGKIMVFDGGYHGGVFYFRRGHGALNAPFDWILAPYNDEAGTRRMLKEHGAALAAVLVEPMLGGGCIPGTREFLGMLREECSANGIVLIFDEVMTSRLSPSGMQGLLGIRPDLTTLGKYLGGGASFGAFGGSRSIMECFEPGSREAFEHAGTFNNNVLSMAAGLAGLTEVFTPSEARRINALGDLLRSSLNRLAREQGLRFAATGSGSLIGLHFKPRHRALSAAASPSVPDASDVLRSQLESLFHFGMLERGFYFGRRGYVSLSLPTGQVDCEAFVAAAADLFADSESPFKAVLAAP